MPSVRSSSRVQRSPQSPLDSERSSHSDAAPSDDFKLTGAARRMQVLLETNSLLEKMGFGSRSFEDYDDLVASVSSMGVALYEKLFQFHLENVVRVPQTPDDYVFNAQLVVDALSGALLDESFDTRHVTGASLCDGDVGSIQQLVRMFMQIYEILYSENPPPKEEEEEEPEEQEEEQEYEHQAVEEERRYERPSRDSRSKKATGETTNGTAGAAKKKKEKVMGSRQAAMANSSSSNVSKHSELRAPRRQASASNDMRRSRTTPMAASHVNRNTTTASILTIKKRTRRVESATTSRSGQNLRRREKEDRADAAMEMELLTTQRYGRFVPVPQRSTRRLDELQDVEDGAGLSASVLELHEEELAAGETYFGGVSSVSGASGSAASIHFMEEEGEFAKNFSNIHSHSSPGTESKDSPETNVTPDHHETRERDDKAPKKSKNHEEAEEEVSPSTSPAKKKLATTQPTVSPTSKRNGLKHQVHQQANDKNAAAGTTTAETKPSLYPLMPETVRHDRTSKAHKEYLRYKIQLKDHLQELRHREFCQRQHLERAFRLGEHAANVERIRARRFEQELRLHRISIGLDAKTQEEKQLRDAMQHMLHLEKEKLRDEHKTTKQMLKAIQHEHAEREQAMENFYATQIQLVKEQTRRELTEREAVEKAHRMASEQMIREMKRERERELGALLTEKQHLAEVRRFRHATQLTHAIEKGAEVSARQGDAFYAAAMKARQLRAMKTTTSSASTIPTKTQPRRMAATRAVYNNRPTARRTAVRV